MQKPLPPVTLLMKESSASTFAAAEKLVTPVVEHQGNKKSDARINLRTLWEVSQ